MGLPKKIPKSRPVTKADEVRDDDKRVIVNRYRVEKKLGSGNFGTAFLVKDLKAKSTDDELKVLKEIPCGDLQPDETVDAMHEAKLLSKLDNNGIVKFHDSFLDGQFFCIVTEYCEGGDLDEHIVRMSKRGQAIPEKQVLEWTAQLLLAVHYMHSRRVLHRDLKARNIFLKKNCIKVGDFGISRILMGTADMATTFTGTPYYMSPEVLKHEGYNSKSDVWSVGCIIYELCCLKHAFEGKGLMGGMYKIVEGDCPSLPDKYSSDLQTVLRRIFTKEPDKRPGASEVLKIPIIQRYAQRHLEKLKAESSQIKSSTDDAETEAQAIEMTLKKKHHKKDLQLVAEENKHKNLTPRERARLRKKEESDRKARQLAESARVNLMENVTRKQQLKATLKQSGPAPWQHDKQIDDNTFVVKGKEAGLSNFGPKRPTTAPAPSYRESDESEDEDTIVSFTKTVPPLSNLLPMAARSQLAANRTLDDRPITPMKNRMIYDVRHSTLDFKDGIPDDPKLADTYYSQYDEEFTEDTAESDGNEDDVGSNQGDENTLDDASSDEYEEGTLLADGDEEYMLRLMQEQFGTAENEAENTLVLADDKTAGAFGPGARSIKIKNLKANCIKKLGVDVFSKAYDYLKRAHFDNNDSFTMDESAIWADLAKITPQISDCFVVEQLLFLELQATSDSLS